MKNILIILLFFCVAIPLQAQKGSKGADKKPKTEAETPPAAAPAETGKDEQFAFHRALYEQGRRYNDLNVCTEAMHAMIALHPLEKNLLDSLAILYFQRSAWGQCALVATEALKYNSENAAMLELRGVSYQSLGMPIESLADFEKLYGISKNPYHLYEISSLQFSIRRFGECEVTINKLLNDPDIKDKTMVLGTGERRQEVPMAAACLNIRGVLDLEQGKIDSAKPFFEAALKLKPDFELAKNNLEMANKAK